MAEGRRSVNSPFFLTLEAEACLESGRIEAALQAIEEALAASRDTGECWALAEMLRIKARLLQAMGQAGAEEIETILINSLEIARRQQARCWELRASCDLARLWQDQGRERKALKLLQSVYDQFTEGLDMADLRDAKALIGCLRQKVGWKQKGRTPQHWNTTTGVSDATSTSLLSHQVRNRFDHK